MLKKISCSDLHEYSDELKLALVDIEENFITTEFYGSSYQTFLKNCHENSYLEKFHMTKTKAMEDEMQKTMRDFAKYLLENIRERLNSKIVDDFSIFNDVKIRDLSQNSVPLYGLSNLGNLIDHYGFEKMNESG